MFKATNMKKYIFLLLIASLLISTACSANESTDHMAIIDSTDYKRQVEVLPLLLEEDKFNELFPASEHDSEELDTIYADLLIKYLVALMETDEDDLLRDNIVGIYRSFRHGHHGSPRATDLFLLSDDYIDKLGIILPEMIRAFDEIDEERFDARRWWGTHIWNMMVRHDRIEAEKWDEKLEDIVQELLIAFDYEKQIHEGELTLDDVPQRYRLQVERLIDGRHDDGSFDLIIVW